LLRVISFNKARVSVYTPRSAGERDGPPSSQIILF
jgi:hypothetical protein